MTLIRTPIGLIAIGCSRVSYDAEASPVLGMRILLAIVHHWNPSANGRHGSLRSDPTPRKLALQDQLLALRRLGHMQGTLSIAERMVKPANQALRHSIDINVITDGSNSVLHLLDPSFADLYTEIPSSPISGMFLGFEAQKFLGDHISDPYDLYGYVEDDLIVSDPLFFHKIFWFATQLNHDAVLLPHRLELTGQPDVVDKFFIDGPVPRSDLISLISDPAPSLKIETPSGSILYESPLNPHSGCFFLTKSQLERWVQSDSWQDGDVSYVSPLESAATLGITKNFDLYKPALSHASWLEIQHWGSSFRRLIGTQVSLATS